MVTEEQARKIAREVLGESVRGPVVLRYVRDLLDDREERITREAQLRAALREAYKLLRAGMVKLEEQGKRLAASQSAADADAKKAADSDKRARRAMSEEGLEPRGRE